MTPLITTQMLLAALCLTACGTPGTLQAYTRIDEPLFAVIRELDKHPGNTAAQNILPILHAQAVAKHEKAIQIYSARENFYNVLHELEALQHIYNALQSVPAALAIVKPRDYSKMIAALEGPAQYYNWISVLYPQLGEQDESDNQ
jgi:hypothetical protein